MKLSRADNGAVQRIHIDRKIIGILLIFSILGLLLVTSIVIATNTLSALRAYSTLQTNYTERRKQATLELIQYAQSENQIYLQNFRQSLNIIENARLARKELLKKETDRRKVHQYLRKTHTVPDDIDPMITTFERFHAFPHFQEAINHWIASDQLIQDMQQVADSIHQTVDTQVASPEFRRSEIAGIRSLDKQLTEEQYKLAASLSLGTAFLNKILVWASIFLGGILLLTGIMLSFRFLKSIKKWHKTVKISEQRYRSLFEYNPSAVFQMLPSGRLLSGNKSLMNLSGYGPREISSLKLEDFVGSEHKQKAAASFQNAANGISQSLEVIWKNKGTNKKYIHLTLLPIYINDAIIGVFGIAEDISYQKYAERKIKDQLDEKTHLLSEIHDRVKNNLALISGLLQLQQETVETEETRKHLDSAISRIHSMALVHEHLYQTGTFANIQFDEYIRELSYSIRQSSRQDPSKYEIEIRTDPVTLGLKKAISTGLLLNELLKNAFRFAFPEHDGGKINIDLLQGNDHIILQVADNGRGLPKDVDSKQQASLGLQLIRILSTQLDATMNINYQEGTKFTFHIPFDK